MFAYIVRRLYYMFVTLLIISIISFIIINLPPGTYLDIKIEELRQQGTVVAENQIESLKKRFRLDEPIYSQYLRWITGFVQGDFGRSFIYEEEVSELIWERLGYSVILSLSTMIFTQVVSIAIGIYSATHQYSLGDNIFTLLGFIGLSIPNFLLALIIVVIAAFTFDVQVGGLFSDVYRRAPMSLGKFVDLLKHLWIPVVVVGTAGTAGGIRVMRGNLLDILGMQYMQTARAKGLNENVVILKHGVRNALHPIIMSIGMSFPQILSGATIVSLVLNLPTMGPIYINALKSQDMFLAGTFLVFMAIMLVIGNLLADLLLVIVDPRIRFE